MAAQHAKAASAVSVLHLFRAPVGGLFRHVRDLARGQAGLGMNVGVICDSGVTGGFVGQALKELEGCCSLGVHRAPMSRQLSLSDVKALRRISDICARRRPDILHGHGAKGGAYARLLAHRHGAKAVYTPHGGSLHYSARSPAGLVFLGLERLLRRRTDGFVFECAFSAQAYLSKMGASDKPTRVVHNGLSGEEFRPLSQEDAPFDFVYVGELRLLKGVDVLIEAASRIAPARSIRLLIAGDGPDRALFERRIHDLGLDGRITLSPAIYPARAAFAQGRAVVVPSRAEAFPYIVLEAAAAGMPLLASRVGGIPEILGESAPSLVPPDDAVALAGAMQDFLDSPDTWRRRALAARDRVSARFQVAGMIGAISSFYGELLDVETSLAATNTVNLPVRNAS